MIGMRRVVEDNAAGRAGARRPGSGLTVRGRVLAGLALCLVLSGLPGPIWAAPVSPVTEATSLSFLPDPAAIQGCETIPVAVWVNDVIDLYGADIALAFDAGVLEVVDADATRPGIQVQNGGFLRPDFVVNREADNSAGTVRYTVSQAAPSLPVDGSGILFTILFRAKSAAAASALTFTLTELVDLDGMLLAVEAADGAVSAAAPAEPTLTIVKLNAADVRLSWTAAPGVSGYRLYRNASPYFAPTGPAYQVTGNLSYADLGVLGHPAVNIYYVVASACASGFCSQPSNRVGKFEFSLVPGGS